MRKERKGTRHYSRTELADEVESCDAILHHLKQIITKQVSKVRFNRLVKAYRLIMMHANDLENELEGHNTKEHSLKRKRTPLEH